MVEEGDQGGAGVTARSTSPRAPRTGPSPTCRRSDSWKLDPDAAYVHYLLQRDHRRRRVPLDARHRRRAAGRRHVVATSCRGRSTCRKYGLIYAGAQKNIGPAGLTIVIVRDDLIGQAQPGTPSVLDYKTQADERLDVNTPPTYAIYIAGLVFQWLKEQRRPGRRSSKRNIAQGEAALRLPRRQRLLPQPGGAGRPLADERAVHAAPTRRSTTRS